MAADPGGTPTLGQVRARQRVVMTGLLLTFLGILLVAFGLPVTPGALIRAIPLAAGAVVCLWLGGILLGSVRRPRGFGARRGAR